MHSVYNSIATGYGGSFGDLRKEKRLSETEFIRWIDDPSVIEFDCEHKPSNSENIFRRGIHNGRLPDSKRYYYEIFPEKRCFCRMAIEDRNEKILGLGLQGLCRRVILQTVNLQSRYYKRIDDPEKYVPGIKDENIIFEREILQGRPVFVMYKELNILHALPIPQFIIDYIFLSVDVFICVHPRFPGYELVDCISSLLEIFKYNSCGNCGGSTCFNCALRHAASDDDSSISDHVADYAPTFSQDESDIWEDPDWESDYGIVQHERSPSNSSYEALMWE